MHLEYGKFALIITSWAWDMSLKETISQDTSYILSSNLKIDNLFFILKKRYPNEPNIIQQFKY